MSAFLPGLQLSELFYREAVKPILEAAFPQVVYSAALIGPGSEVLGYDTAQSMDHHWGPKVQHTKWFGTAFSRLQAASDLVSLFQGVLLAQHWKEREKRLSQAYEKVARLHNQLGITEPLETSVSPYYGRPYLVVHGDRFAEAIKAQIQDPTVKKIPVAVGSINQFVDSTDILSNPFLTKKFQTLFRQG